MGKTGFVAARNLFIGSSPQGSQPRRRKNGKEYRHIEDEIPKTLKIDGATYELHGYGGDYRTPEPPPYWQDSQNVLTEVQKLRSQGYHCKVFDTKEGWFIYKYKWTNIPLKHQKIKLPKFKIPKLISKEPRFGKIHRAKHGGLTRRIG